MEPTSLTEEFYENLSKTKTEMVNFKNERTHWLCNVADIT